MRRRDLLLGAGLLVVVCGFFFPILSGEKFYYYRDLLVFVYPLKSFWATSVLAGDFPLWNPHLYMGSPFLAQVDNAVLYPLNILFLLLPVERAFGLVAVLNFAVAALAMYALARQWIGCPWSALIASTSYALGGFLVFVADNPPYLLSGALIPLAFLSLTRALSTGKLRWVGALSLVTAVQLSGGDPQTVLYEYIFLALWAAMAPDSGGKGRGGTWKRALLRLAPVLVSGLLMAGLLAAVLVPAVAMIRDSVRLESISLEDATGWSLAPERLAGLVVPYLFGLGKAANLYLGAQRPWVNCIFVGLLPLAALPFALGRLRRNRVTQFALAVLVLGLALSMGRHTPLYGWLYEWVPLFRGFRYPIKSFVFVAFALALLGGLGFAAIFSGDRARVRRTTLWACGGSLASGLMLLLLSWIAGLDRTVMEVSAFLARHGISDAPRAVAENAQARTFRSALYLLLLAVGFLLARRRWTAGACATVVSLFFVLFHLSNLLPVTHEYAYFWTGRTVFDRVPGTVRAIEARRHGPVPPRIFSFDLLINEQVDYGLPLNPWEEHRLWDRATLTRDNALSYGFSYFKGYQTFEPGRFAALRAAIDLADLPHVATVFDVRFLIIPPLNAPPPRFLKRIETGEPGPFEMYENLKADPRAFLVPAAEVVADADAALRRVLAPSFDPRATAVLEEKGEDLQGAGPFAARGWVEYTAFSPDQRAFRVTTEADQFLVEREAWSPGWEATVDGRSVPLFRINYLMRGLRVPKGDHEVVLRYAPRSFRIGGIIAVASLVVVIALCVTDKQYGRGPGPTPPVGPSPGKRGEGAGEQRG